MHLLTPFLRSLLALVCAGLLSTRVAHAATRTVNPGQTVTLSVSVYGTAPFSYQWRKNSAPIPGATDATYTISAISAADAGAYSVVISNPYGVTTSDDAIVLVAAVVGIPVITAHPSPLIVTAGQPASFAVTASGSGLYYQWRKNGSAISGATSATYTIAAAAPADAASYSVIVSNSAGFVTSADASLTVNSIASPPPPTLTELTPQSYSARGDYGPAEGISKLFDGQHATKWLDFSGTSWVQIEFASPASLGAYSLTSANDAPERDPASWTLSGSNDGLTWTTIETRSNQSWNSRFLTRDFALPSPSATYTRYRFSFQATAGNIVQLAELELYGVDSPTPPLSVVNLTPQSYTTRGQNGHNEGIAKLFDGQSATKWLDFSPTSWVQITLSDAATLEAYSLTSANDAPERDPASWTLSGSNDGLTWTTIETRSNQSWNSRFLTRDFALAAPSAAFTHYRFNLQATSGSIIQLAELQLFGTSQAPPVPSGSEVSPQSYTARGQNGYNEGIAKLFDNQSSTKWLDFSPSTWVRVEMPLATSLSHYSLTSANDAPERDPASWTLSGSNDGLTWTVLEHRSGQAWSSRFQTREFTLTSPSAPYKQFRFEIQATYGTITQIADLKLFGTF